MALRIAVVGMGNSLSGDDRVGLEVASALRCLLSEFPVAGVEVFESVAGGLDLMVMLQGFDAAIVIDCYAAEQPVPGRVHRLKLDALGRGEGYRPGLAEVFELARELRIPAPREIDVMGVEGAALGMVTDRMTPSVEAAIAPLALDLHAELRARVGG
ncbi:MAG: hydrogenase maturation protease [Bryobacteraceae bacterium]|nr:hydrogenase maturation protease [Bryobacteraceae bacterium]